MGSQIPPLIFLILQRISGPHGILVPREVTLVQSVGIFLFSLMIGFFICNMKRNIAATKRFVVSVNERGQAKLSAEYLAHGLG